MSHLDLARTKVKYLTIMINNIRAIQVRLIMVMVVGWVFGVPWESRGAFWCNDCSKDSGSAYRWMCPDIPPPCGSEEGCCPNPSSGPGHWHGLDNSRWHGLDSGSGCGSCGSPGTPNVDYAFGMPRWSVTEPGLVLWLSDVPLYYQPSKGPPVAFELQFKNDLVQLRAFFVFGGDHTVDRIV